MGDDDAMRARVHGWLVASLLQTNARNGADEFSPFLDTVVDAATRVVTTVADILGDEPDIGFHAFEERVWQDVPEANIWYNNSQTIDKHEATLKAFKEKLAKQCIAQIQNVLLWDERGRTDYSHSQENDANISRDASDLIDLIMSILIANHDYAEDAELPLPRAECTDLLELSKNWAGAAATSSGRIIQQYITLHIKAWDIRQKFLLNRLRPLMVKIIGFGPTGGLLANLLKQNSATHITIYESRSKEVSMQECLKSGEKGKCYAERWQYLTNKCSSFLRFAVGERAWKRMLRDTEVIFFGAEVNNREFALTAPEGSVRHTGTDYAPETVRASTGTFQALMLSGLTGFTNVSSHFDMPTKINAKVRQGGMADIVVLTMGCSSKVQRELEATTETICPRLNAVSLPSCETYGVTGLLIEDAKAREQPGYAGKRAAGEDWFVERTAVRPQKQLHTLTTKLARHITIERTCVVDHGKDIWQTFNLKHTDVIRNAALEMSAQRQRKLRYFLSKCDSREDVEHPREASHKYIEHRFDLEKGSLWAFSAFKAVPRLVENPINVDEYLDAIGPTFVEHGFSQHVECADNTARSAQRTVPLVILAGDTAANAHPLSGHGQDGAARMSRQIDTLVNTMSTLKLLQDHPRADVINRSHLFELLRTQLELTNEALQATNKTIFLNHLISALYTNRQLLKSAQS